MKKITIAVHDGMFHADDVFATAILKKIYPNLKVIRTRDKDILEKVDMRVDVGGKYSARSGNFDHHQEGSPNREGGLPYSSCGLIWKHFGRKIVNSDEAFSHIDKKLIEFIDASDNGVGFSNDTVRVYSIASVVSSFNQIWNEKKSEKKCFDEAVKLVSKILDREIEKANSISDGNKIVKEALKKAEKHFVVLPKAGLPKDLILADKNMKFTIFPSDRGDWIASAVSVEEKGFERRHYFPKAWAGLIDEDLEKVSGIMGAEFCHKHRFISTAKTKEAVIEMVKKALKK